MFPFLEEICTYHFCILLPSLVPLHPRHFAGEVGVPGLRLAEDALLHQLCTEGLGGLESCCVGLGLGDSKGKLTVDLPRLDIRNTILRHQVVSHEPRWFLLPTMWWGMLSGSNCSWGFLGLFSPWGGIIVRDV